MKENEIENDYARFYIKGEILYFVYKDKVNIDLEAAKLIVSDRIKLQQDKSLPVICYVNSLSGSDKPARDYLAKEGSQLTKAVALVVNSPAIKVITNFYLLVNKPLVPTKVFINEEEAISYLKTFKD